MDLVKYKLFTLEWEVLQDIEVTLEVPSAAQQIMCGECSPLLGGAIPAYETFIFQWKHLASSSTHPQIGAFVLQELPTANKYHDLMLKNKTYIYAMFVDPCIRFLWIHRHWGTKVSSARSQILNKLCEYRPSDNINSDTAPGHLRAPAQPRAFMSLADWYGLPNMRISHEDKGPQSIEEEFASYVGTISHVTMDPLAFWGLEAARFPTIFPLAMDILPIQASAVLRERVFSSSTETDTKKCNQISLFLMEALQMSKFMKKQDQVHFTQGWKTSQKDMMCVRPDNVSLAQLTAENRFNEVFRMISEQEEDKIAECPAIL